MGTETKMAASGTAPSQQTDDDAHDKSTHSCFTVSRSISLLSLWLSGVFTGDETCSAKVFTARLMTDVSGDGTLARRQGFFLFLPFWSLALLWHSGWNERLKPHSTTCTELIKDNLASGYLNRLHLYFIINCIWAVIILVFDLKGIVHYV